MFGRSRAFPESSSYVLVKNNSVFVKVTATNVQWIASSFRNVSIIYKKINVLLSYGRK